MLDTMIYDTEAPTLLEGFGVTQETKDKLIQEYLVGSRAEILAKICNHSILPQAHKYLLLIEFGVRLTIEEINDRHEKLKEFNAINSGGGEENRDLP